MSAAATWILVVAVGCCGCALVVASLGQVRRPALARRLARYTGERVEWSRGGIGSGAIVASFARWLASAVGDAAETARRLSRAGREGDGDRYQRERARWALAWAGTTAMLGILALVSGRVVSPVIVLLTALALAPGGVVICDRRLRAAADRRIAALIQELPAAVDLLALSLGAGESARSALARVAATSRGPCAEELGRVVTDLGAGVPLREALSALVRRLDLVSLRRLADTVASTAERGAPAADALGALAADLREQLRRELTEDAARRQIAMLVPVVGLILPAALLFAFYPAIVALGRLAA